jgi:hypothetical protein
MATHSHPPDQQLVRHVLDAFEREFWAGHHDRGRLLAAPLRVIHQAIDPAEAAAGHIEGLLAALEGNAPRPAPQG